MNSDLDEFLGVSGTAVRHSIGVCLYCKCLVFPENWTLKKMVIAMNWPIPSTGPHWDVLKPICDSCAAVGLNQTAIRWYESKARPGDYPGMTWNYRDSVIYPTDL